MLFSSNVFLFLFLPAVLFGYYVLLKERHHRNIFLLVASLGFYAWGEPRFVFVMILSILCNWALGLLTARYRDDKRRSRAVILLMLTVNFSILFLFKYLMFTIESINRIAGSALPVPHILLPVGISFFTFQAISYVLDVSRGDAQPQRSLLNVALYIAMFPQLIAGPIVRYKTVAEQIGQRKESFDEFGEGVERFIIGLGKKVVLANSLAVVADEAFLLPSGELSVSFAWIGIAAYSFQIFFDFSGYSDMAVGLGRMFGFHFPENFNYPYIARSISDFWRRWHISLSSWFRDYVYIPLGGSLVNSTGRLLLNLLIVWSLTGLWHGANWTFVAWGFFYFVLLACEKLLDAERVAEKHPWLGHIYVWLAVMIGWVLFRSDSMGDAIAYLGVMFGSAGSPMADLHTTIYLNEYKYYFLFAMLFSMPVRKIIPAGIRQSKIASLVQPAGYLLLLVLSVSFIVKDTYNPFIYFNF